MRHADWQPRSGSGAALLLMLVVWFAIVGAIETVRGIVGFVLWACRL